MLPRDELRDLIAAAERIDARPVVAIVWQERVQFCAASTGKVLAETMLQPQQRQYRDDAPNENRWWWVSRRYARGLWQRAQFKAERNAEYHDA